MLRVRLGIRTLLGTCAAFAILFWIDNLLKDRFIAAESPRLRKHYQRDSEATSAKGFLFAEITLHRDISSEMIFVYRGCMGCNLLAEKSEPFLIRCYFAFKTDEPADGDETFKNVIAELSLTPDLSKVRRP